MKKGFYYIGVLGSGGIESTTILTVCSVCCPNLTIDFGVDSKESLLNSNYISIIESLGGNILQLTDYDKCQNKLGKAIALYRICKWRKYDFYHLHFSYPSSLFYVLILKIAGAKKVYATSHARGSSIRGRGFAASQFLSRLVFPFFCTRRFAVSKDAGHWMYGMYSFDVIPNGIDVARFKYNTTVRDEVRRSLGVKETTILLGHIGRFATAKNQKFAVDVFAEFNKINSDSKLLLVGEGELKEMIIERCEDLGITNAVLFKNYTTTPEHYLWAMDLFLMPSQNEGFGLVAVEAQAASLPVIASDQVPIETKLADTITYLPLKKDLWVRKIDDILETGHRREVCNDIRLSKCDIKTIANKYRRIYND